MGDYDSTMRGFMAGIAVGLFMCIVIFLTNWTS